MATKTEAEATKTKAEAKTPEADTKAAEKTEIVVPATLGTRTNSFITEIRNASKAYLKEIDADMKGKEPGDAYYGQLKFARIRADRLLKAMDELAAGKPVR